MWRETIARAMMEAMKKDGLALQYAAEEPRADRTIVMEAVKETDYSAYLEPGERAIVNIGNIFARTVGHKWASYTLDDD